MIEPYEQTLNKTPIAARRAWAVDVFRDLEKRLPSDATVVILAGERYREFLIDDLERRGHRVEVPMAGLGIGQQLAWLKEHTHD